MLPDGCYGPLLVPDMNRRSIMLTVGIGALAAAIPTPKARANPPRPAAPAPGAQASGFLFHDEFDAVHADPFGTAFETHPIGMDGGWHTWRVTWNQTGFYFWEDYVDGAQPYFSVSATGIEDLNDPIRKWPFNDPDYTMFPVLNLAVGGSGGGDPAPGLPGRHAHRLGASLLSPLTHFVRRRP
jgi:hypothetical protein